jgi:HlyD family secretion protein
MTRHDERAERVLRTVWWLLAAAALPAAAWLAFAPIATAVVAPAFVKVDLNRRPVQHRDGGTVKSVLVRDGQRVRAGEALLLLGDVNVDAERKRLDYRLQALRATCARLQAEQARAAAPRYPADLLARAMEDAQLRENLDRESLLFAAKRASLDSELALMAEERRHIDAEILALRAQIGQMRKALELRRSTLAMNSSLRNDGYVSATRITQLEAETTDYAATLEERESELARAMQRLAEMSLKMRAAQNAYVQSASDQLRAATAQAGEVEQELRKSDDAAARQAVLAPADGEVIDLQFTSPGAVIRAGETIADIVPVDAQLMIEARIRPEDINTVQVGQGARVKFLALRYRNHAMARGTLDYVSGDRLTDRNSGQPYYLALVRVDAASLREAGDVRLMAGMPAEVFIEGTMQTTLAYLLEPLTSTARKAARQM